MTEPVTESQLYTALDKAHEKRKEYDAVIHTGFRDSIERIETSVNKIEDSLDGNGKPGLKIRIDRLETTNSNFKKFLVGFTGIVGTILSFLGFKSGS